MQHSNYCSSKSPSNKALLTWDCFTDPHQLGKLKTVVFLGDFNVNLLSPPPPSLDMVSTMSAFHHHQVVTDPTRTTPFSSTLIDHVYVSDVSLLSSCLTSSPLGSSDHSCITVGLTWSASHPKRLRRLVWSYRTADWDLANDLLAETLPTNFPESLEIDSI